MIVVVFEVEIWWWGKLMRKKKKSGSERWELRALSNTHDDADPLSTTFRMSIRCEGQDNSTLTSTI